VLGLARHINSRGFHPAAALHLEKCTACAQCGVMCPDACITIMKSE
jgi:2-oxoglutarate ferredoxin oxidoreductase subunit delta